MPFARYAPVAALLVYAGLVSGISFSGILAASAQNAPTPSQLGMQDALNAIQPLLSKVNLAASSVDVHHWKAPSDVRDTTTSDVQSIQRDLNVTLPDLLTKAQASPGAIAPSFAVFRNIDALYDVLLRITETATLAGTQSEADRLEQVRAELQARRAQLGNAILISATSQDTDVVQLRNSLAAAPRVPAASTAPKRIVVDDGPTTSTKASRKKKAATPPPVSANPTPQQ